MRGSYHPLQKHQQLDYYCTKDDKLVDHERAHYDFRSVDGPILYELVLLIEIRDE